MYISRLRHALAYNLTMCAPFANPMVIEAIQKQMGEVVTAYMTERTIDLRDLHEFYFPPTEGSANEEKKNAVAEWLRGLVQISIIVLSGGAPVEIFSQAVITRVSDQVDAALKNSVIASIV